MNFGRFYGTDDYSHLYHTQQMSSSTGLLDFYDRIGTQVADPNSNDNDFNYPFGLWLLGSVLSKNTGLPVLQAEFLFVIIFLLILLGSFYLYCSIWLEGKEQKIIALLFLLSMPTASLSLLSYRPSVFILPFLCIIFYIAFKEPFEWKLIPVVLFSIFIITISHTGTFIFLMSFSIIFFLLYCLLWGKFSGSWFFIIVSTFSIYLLALNWFPQIANQFEVKSQLFLSPGNLLVSKFNFSLVLDLGNVLYQNIIVDKQYVFAIVMVAFIFALGKTFRYIHRKVAVRFTGSESFFPITIPSLNISKSIVGIPFWLGPIHVILSVLGIFRLDNKGKCLCLTMFLVTLAPDFLLTSQFGSGAATGALREISYIILIVPITATLGLWVIIAYLDSLKTPRKSLITFITWVVLLTAIIITPTLATSYYLPKISGEDYVIDGMVWLGGTGGPQEKVAGYGYRTVPIYTNKTDASYGIQNGYDIRTYIKFLKGAYFSSDVKNVEDLQRYYGVNYILVSEKLANNFGQSTDELAIDANPAVDKIYSSKDFGVYKVFSPDMQKQDTVISEGVTLSRTGSGFNIETSTYKIVLNENNPTIERFGTPQNNYLGSGIMSDSIQISGFRQNPPVNPFLPVNESEPEGNSTVDLYHLSQLPVSAEIENNQVIYKTILKDLVTTENVSTLLVRYTFYPKTVKREFLISNDWVTSDREQLMKVVFSTSWFVSQNSLIIKKDDAVLLKRHIYPSEDTVLKNQNIQDLFIYDRTNNGISIKSLPTAPYPSQLYYKGSILYDMSSIGLSQSSSVKPGDTMHITQFISAGDEVSTQQNILTQEGLTLDYYPDAIVPVIMSGYLKTRPTAVETENIQAGYQILQEQGIPYTGILVLKNEPDAAGAVQSTESSASPAATPPATIILPAIAGSMDQVIGSGSTGSINRGWINFDNISTQRDSISSLINYAESNQVSLIGFLPGSLNYNMNTLNVISERNIPFILSRSVSPPTIYEFQNIKERDPSIARYQGNLVDVTLLPVSYPMSSSLSYDSDNSLVFSAWKATLDNAMINDDMVLFLISSSDIGDPETSENFKMLFAYAKDQGFTFSTPDVIVNHFRDLQNIRYHGSIDNDRATVNLTNDNGYLVQDVAFRIVLPELRSGKYAARNGEIIRSKTNGNQTILYVSTDIPASATREIVVEPSAPREKILVALPAHPLEGPITVVITDSNGEPINDIFALIDSKYYQPDAEGKITVTMRRGKHMLEVWSPGYEKFISTIEVKGRFYALETIIGSPR